MVIPALAPIEHNVGFGVAAINRAVIASIIGMLIAYCGRRYRSRTDTVFKVSLLVFSILSSYEKIMGTPFAIKMTTFIVTATICVAVVHIALASLVIAASV